MWFARVMELLSQGAEAVSSPNVPSSRTPLSLFSVCNSSDLLSHLVLPSILDPFQCLPLTCGTCTESLRDNVLWPSSSRERKVSKNLPPA